MTKQRTTPIDSADRPALQIEITPAMIERGVSFLRDSGLLIPEVEPQTGLLEVVLVDLFRIGRGGEPLGL